MPIRIEGSRTLSHRDAVPRNCISHVVIVNQVCKGSSLQGGGFTPAGCHLTVDCWLDEVVL